MNARLTRQTVLVINVRILNVSNHSVMFYGGTTT